MTNRAKRRTTAQIMKNAVPHMTVDQRLAALESMVQLLITKHNGLGHAWAKRRDRDQELIESIVLDVIDLQSHAYGPDPEVTNHPDIKALRRKHCDELTTPKKRARRSAKIIDLAAYRKDDP